MATGGKQRVGDILVARGIVTPEDVHAARVIQQKLRDEGEQVALGEILVRMGKAKPQDIKPARTGDLLIERGVITQIEMQMALATQQRLREAGENLMIGEILIRTGMADRGAVDAAVRETGQAVSGLDRINLPSAIVRKHRIKPMAVRDGVLYLASVEPLLPRDEAEIIEAALSANYQVDRIEVEPRDRNETISWLQQMTFVDRELVVEEVHELCKDNHNAMLMQRFILHMFQLALQEGSSDIHIERVSDPLFSWISYRQDGILRRQFLLTPDSLNAIATSIKTMANLDISESRRPQDGRAAVEFHGKAIDLRVSVAPRDDGETITIRLLDHSKVQTIDQVFRRYPEIAGHMKRIANVRGKSGAIVLVTGPTGQGKSTTLSALLHAMPRTRLKIMTIEDPVENRIPFVHQAMVNPIIGNTYSFLMRANMRQDPDVMMVGEIRDTETSAEFMKGADTGHMMLSTQHTNDVPSAITRLMGLLPEDMRVMSSFTLATALRMVMNQRLVPSLCSCATDHTHLEQKFPELVAALGGDQTGWTPKKRTGCPRCYQTGYKGRELVVEAAFFPANAATQQEMEQVLLSGASPTRLVQCEGVIYFSRRDAVKTLFTQGFIDAETACSVLDLAISVAPSDPNKGSANTPAPPPVLKTPAPVTAKNPPDPQPLAKPTPRPPPGSDAGLNVSPTQKATPSPGDIPRAMPPPSLSSAVKAPAGDKALPLLTDEAVDVSALSRPPVRQAPEVRP